MRTLMEGLAGLFVAYVASCSAISAWHSHGLASVPVGASRAEVLRVPGQPDVVEHAGAPFTRMPAVDAMVAVRSDGGMRTGWAWIPKPGR